MLQSGHNRRLEEFDMGEKMPGTVEAVSKNKAAVVLSNDEGWTVVELIGRGAETAVGDSVVGDWQAVAGEDLIFNGATFSAFFQGTGTKQWALGLNSRLGAFVS
jgi:hypothetical protein